MNPQRPLTDFLSWLIEDPERLQSYQSIEGFQALAEERGLSQELQEILKNNDLQRAMEVIRQETGGYNVVFFVIRFVI